MIQLKRAQIPFQLSEPISPPDTALAFLLLRYVVTGKTSIRRCQPPPTTLATAGVDQ